MSSLVRGFRRPAAFQKAYPRAHGPLVGVGGMPLEELLSHDPNSLSEA